MDDDGNLQEVSSISEGIALAQEYSEDSAEQQVQGRKAQNGNTVIVLDPGHVIHTQVLHMMESMRKNIPYKLQKHVELCWSSIVE